MSLSLARNRMFHIFVFFGTPCYILDMNHSSKFAPKAHEGFLLGYSSNSHTYHVYNSHHGKVMEMVNAQFDDSNGSQKEHLPNVIDELPMLFGKWLLGASSQLKEMHLTPLMMMPL